MDPTITMLDIDSLTPYENNPRHNDDAVEPVARSIEQFGFKVPMVVSKDGVIITGHTRYKAAKKLGLKQAPCIVADDLTEEQMRAFRIIDNKTAEFATWDDDLLEIEIEGLDIDLDDFGFEGLDLFDDKPVETEDVQIPENPRTRSKPGDVYALGDHRLMCGDATEWGDVSIFLDGTPVDLLLTDPPYGVEYVGKTKDALTMENDARDKESLADLLHKSFANCEQVMRPGAVFYVFHADINALLFRAALDDVGLEVRQCLIWVKNSLVLGRQDYQWRHEPCLYGWKDGAAHSWFSDRKQTTVLEFERPNRSSNHSTSKPVPLIGYLMSNSSSGGGGCL